MFFVYGHVRYLRIELNSEINLSLFVRLKNDEYQISRHLWGNCYLKAIFHNPNAKRNSFIRLFVINCSVLAVSYFFVPTQWQWEQRAIS